MKYKTYHDERFHSYVCDNDFDLLGCEFRYNMIVILEWLKALQKIKNHLCVLFTFINSGYGVKGKILLEIMSFSSELF